MLLTTSVATPGLRRRVATGAVMCGLIVSGLEGTAVTSAMPKIVADLGGLALFPWVFSGFLVASTVAVPVAGRAADRLGRKPVFLAGMALFLVASVLCGLSGSMLALVFFRVLQGAGVGVIAPLVPTISADLYSLAERARVQALFTGAWGAANVAGPLLGGWLVAHASWRWVFFITLPFGLLSCALLTLSYADVARPRTARADTPALVSFAAATFALLLALEAPGLAGSRARPLLFGVGLIFATACVVRHGRVPDALFPSRALADPVVRAGTVGSLFTGAVVYGVTAFVPLWVATGRGGSTLLAGVSLIPLLLGWSAGTILGVRAFVRWGSNVVSSWGMAVVAAGLALLAWAASAHAPLSLAFSALALGGLGLGPSSASWLLSAQARVGGETRGAVTGLIHAARTFGGSLAVALLALIPSLPDDPSRRFALLALLAALGPVLAIGLLPRRRFLPFGTLSSRGRG